MKKIRVGLFGLWMRSNFYKICESFEDVEVVAVCDRDGKRMENFLKNRPEYKGKVFYNFDEFIDCGLDAVFLLNYFHEHDIFAKKALEKGIHVLSEISAAPTMKRCVELCEAVEASGCIYCLGENYPFSAAGYEMKKLVNEGTFGRILYAESEYNHPSSYKDMLGMCPGDYHWRRYIPTTYYVNHTLGPLMYFTEQRPVKVAGFAVQSYWLTDEFDFLKTNDAFGMMNIYTDDGALWRLPACAKMAAPSGTRLCGEFGSVETGRSLGGDLFVYYGGWCIPEGKERTRRYTPVFDENAEDANNAGHSGGDYWVAYNFFKAIRTNTQPFFDVYKGCEMAAVGILAWRSVLNNSQIFDIPDFRNKEEREKYRDDDLNPFINSADEVQTLPSSTLEARTQGYNVAVPARKA